MIEPARSIKAADKQILGSRMPTSGQALFVTTAVLRLKITKPRVSAK